jgi:hypothetical protein
MRAALAHWEPPTKSPTSDGRWVGSFLEEELRDHLKKEIPEHIERFGGPTEYPDVSLKDNDRKLYAFEVKATKRDEHVNNRTKSPESIVRNYSKFEQHWVVAILYRLDPATRLLSDVETMFVELWKYTSTSFKDYSALAALGSFDEILRKKSSDRQFRSEKEFLEFVKYMSQHPGPIIERNKLAKKWLEEYRTSG